MPRKQNRFTLTEVLIVIAIIGVLAALLSTVTSSSMNAARRASCISNLRNIVAGLNMYAPVNDFCLPYCTMTPSNPPPGEEHMPSIVETLNGYLDDPNVFRCPGDPDAKYFKRDGTSYEWQSSLVNGRRMHPVFLKLLGIDRFLMMDTDNFHPDTGESAKNYLYLDGTVVTSPKGL